MAERRGTVLGGAKPDELARLERFLEVDEDDLPRCWREQPVRYMEIARSAAGKTATKIEAEYIAKRVEADLTLRFRKNGVAEGIKTTDETVKAAVRADASFLAAEKLRWKAALEEELLGYLLKAMEMRERTLKYLTLFQGYEYDATDAEQTASVSRATRIASPRYR